MLYTLLHCFILYTDALKNHCINRMLSPPPHSNLFSTKSRRLTLSIVTDQPLDCSAYRRKKQLESFQKSHLEKLHAILMLTYETVTENLYFCQPWYAHQTTRAGTAERKFFLTGHPRGPKRHFVGFSKLYELRLAIEMLCRQFFDYSEKNHSKNLKNGNTYQMEWVDTRIIMNYHCIISPFLWTQWQIFGENHTFIPTPLFQDTREP